MRAIIISTSPSSPSFSFAQVQTADKGQQSNAPSPGLSQDVLCRLWSWSLTDHLPCDYLCVFVVSADFHKSLWVLDSITTWQMKKQSQWVCMTCQSHMPAGGWAGIQNRACLIPEPMSLLLCCATFFQDSTREIPLSLPPLQSTATSLAQALITI